MEPDHVSVIVKGNCKTGGESESVLSAIE